MFIKLNTFFSLGLLNVLHVLFYRLRITLGLFLFPKFTFSQKNLPFYTASLFPPLPIQFASADRLLFFGDPNQSIPVLCSPPNWYRNYFSSCDSDSFGVDWWKVPDFDPKLGDIKIIWELSRFHWVVLFAQAVRQGDTSYLSRLNFWLHDWLFQNPPYKGVNWKCGQEVSIRLINLVIALIILKQDLRAPSYLISLIHIHLKRIVPTIKYALAQNNNHGTSEAAALFIGGTLLQLNGFNNGRYFAKLGRRLLENRAFKLISHDGCFSQYSTNYHRLMLDTYSVVEIWRRRHNLAPFSSIFYVKLSSASNWILNMVCSITGECPNTGANDGARLLQLSNTSFRDFRPCVQLSMIQADLLLIFYAQ